MLHFSHYLNTYRDVLTRNSYISTYMAKILDLIKLYYQMATKFFIKINAKKVCHILRYGMLSRKATTSNDNMTSLLSIVESGMPEFQNQLPSHDQLQECHQFREHPLTTDDVIIYKDRVVILYSFRKEVLLSLHLAHSGVTAMICSEPSIFWPGITPTIHATCQQCNLCNCMAPGWSQPQ